MENLHLKYQIDTFDIKGARAKNVIFRKFDLVFDLWPTFEIFSFNRIGDQKPVKMSYYTTFYDFRLLRYEFSLKKRKCELVLAT